GLSATITIFGGLPPYTVTSSTSGLALSRDTVSFSGGTVDVRPTGACLSNAPITIRDASGHTTTVTVSNIVGTVVASPLSVSPETVTLSTCSSIATVSAAGGTGNYNASAGSDALLVGRTSGGFIQIQRNPNNLPPPSGALTVGISDGASTKTVTVNLTGQAAG